MSLYFLKCSKTFYFQRIHSWQTWNCCWSTDDCNLRHSSYTNTGHNWLLKFDLTEDLDWLVWMNTLINVIPTELPTVMQIRRKIFKPSNWLECWVFDPKKKGPNALPASNHCWVECLRRTRKESEDFPQSLKQISGLCGGLFFWRKKMNNREVSSNSKTKPEWPKETQQLLLFSMTAFLLPPTVIS